MTEIYEKSTYRHEFDVEDSADGEPVELFDATLRYVLTTDRAGGETLAEYTEDDAEVDVEPDDESGLVVVEVPADTIESGRLWEELRISFPDDRSAVVYQAEQTFSRVATEPPTT